MSENRKVTVPLGRALEGPTVIDMGLIIASEAHRRTGRPTVPSIRRQEDRMPVPSEHAVVIAGAGPTGMMLGAELALAGVDVVLVERRATSELEGSRGGAARPA